MQMHGVALFQQRNWLAFHDAVEVSKCIKNCPPYLKDILMLNAERQTRSSGRFSKRNLVCPRYTRVKEGGEHFKLLRVNFGTLFHHTLKRPTRLRPLKRDYLVAFVTHTKKLTILLSKDFSDLQYLILHVCICIFIVHRFFYILA